MLARYVQKGDAIDYRPAEAVAAGDVVIIADLIGIARLDIEANTLGSLAVVGVFDVVKADGAIPFEPLPRQGHCGCGGGRRYGSCASQRPVQPRDDLCRRRSDHGSDRQFGRNSVRHDSRSLL